MLNAFFFETFLVKALSLTGLLAIAGLGAAVPDTAWAQDGAVRPVKLMTVEERAKGVTRQFFGQVVARETVDLAFQVGGQIEQFPVIEGQQIAAGALIAQLDLEPFELQLDQANLQLDQAERTLARLSQLSGTAVSRVAADDAETQVGLSRIAVRNAEYSMEHATLHAPFDALVAARNVATFTTVAAGTPIVRLHDMSDLRIEIDVPEILFQRAGENADVTLMAKFPVRDELYPLKIREFDAEASAVGQTFRLTLGMDRPAGLSVLPGSSVTVLATLADEGALPIIPVTAMQIANDGSVHVMVFEATSAEEGTVSRREITVEPDRDGVFQLVSGLNIGDEIVMTGANALSDGQAVRRFTGFAD
ncbi:efflux RND transporter periplasmic adaptor subunit [Actibacterium pelagium]|uniref:Hemolysin secretion protein D n=1 Tax=Actibacterium pelagium TaxID=2029103 RepID=A0A917EMT3_9RHOB|nr:efflux RND transporter periplasmic adaptor subunit [Actibacterium pelagium]GGE62257.1 hemolysin secretion protein D [Actibacterium pelagium]